MGKWGSQFVRNTSRKRNANFGVQEAVGRLSPSARQAMLVAIEHRETIAKGTWNGCAFNAAGQEVGESVHSYSKAAQVFGMETSDVQFFIRHWDSSTVTDEQLKQLLMDEVLFEDENKVERKKVNSVRVWTSEETKRREEFEAMVKDLDFENVTPDTEELIANAHTLSELVCV